MFGIQLPHLFDYISLHLASHAGDPVPIPVRSNRVQTAPTYTEIGPLFKDTVNC